jgi:outer membrane protein TolC
MIPHIQSKSPTRVSKLAGLVAVVLLATAPATADASELDSTSTLRDYVAYALERNPSLLAYADLHAASRELPRQAKALPDAMVSFGYFASPVETRVGAQETSIRVSQRFPFFGKRALSGRIAHDESRVVASVYDSRRLDVTREVQLAYYEYYRVDRTLDVTRAEKDVLRRMQSAAQVRYASGLVAQQDVLKAQLAVSNLEDRLRVLEADMVSAKARLNRLMNRRPEATLARPIVPQIDPRSLVLEELYERALSGRPELARAESLIERARDARRLASKQYYPDLDIGFDYTWVSERDDAVVPDNGQDILRVTASINLPIGLGKLRAGVREQEARVSVAEHQRSAVRTDVMFEVRHALERVHAAYDQLKLNEQVIVPQAQQTFLASEAGYQTGKVDFLNYLDSQRALLAIRQTQVLLVSQLGIRTAEWERAVGTSFKDMTSTAPGGR